MCIRESNTDPAEEGEASAGGDEGQNPQQNAHQKEEDEALNTKYLRLRAEFQNYKRRAEKEKGDIYAYANEKLVTLSLIHIYRKELSKELAEIRAFLSMSGLSRRLTAILNL